MTPTPQSPTFPTRPLVFALRLLVLLPLLTLRDSAARPTFPQPVELENTAARLVRLPKFSADPSGLLESDPRSATTFQPTSSLLLTKKTWPGLHPTAVATLPATPASTVAPAPSPNPPAPAFHPSHPNPTATHPVTTPSRPSRTLAAARGTPSPSPASDLAQLAAQWKHSPDLRDRLLAFYLSDPVPTSAATITTPNRPATLDHATPPPHLHTQLTFNPLRTVSHQFRAFAAPSDSSARLQQPSGLTREFALLGGRLPGSHSELRLGFVDLSERQFRLNPGNFRSEESRERTAAVSARFRF